MSKRLYLIFILPLFFASCSDKKKDLGTTDKTEKAYLPESAGEPNAILVVMDTTEWNGAIGGALRGVYSEYVKGLPQPEPYFKVRNVNPLKFNTIIKRASNLIFVHTLDSKGRQAVQMEKYYSGESLEKIANDPALFMLPQKDVYARDQTVLHLFGQTKEQLIQHISENEDKLMNYFKKAENDRLAKKLFKVREKQVEKRLAQEYDFTLSIPYGFEVAKALPDFVWIRQLDAEWEKDVFVYFKTYDSHEPFEDVLEYRESITSMYMRDVQKPDIYMTLQDDLSDVREVNFKGKYAKEARGLWKFSDISGGGPYVSYVFVDEEQHRVYYLEGFVYNPGGDKRVFMQEMEMVLQSFTSSLSTQG